MAELMMPSVGPVSIIYFESPCIHDTTLAYANDIICCFGTV